VSGTRKAHGVAMILAAAGTSHPRATPSPRHAPAGPGRIVVASYLLAEDFFQDRLHHSGADVVTGPLGSHPGVARLIASRFRRALLPVPA
jgi:sirohydrochlorin ferrochelatase